MTHDQDLFTRFKAAHDRLRRAQQAGRGYKEPLSFSLRWDTTIGLTPPFTSKYRDKRRGYTSLEAALTAGIDEMSQMAEEIEGELSEKSKPLLIGGKHQAETPMPEQEGKPVSNMTVPVNCPIPEGYKPDRVDIPNYKRGELVLGPHGRILTEPHRPVLPCLIVRLIKPLLIAGKPSDWPEWFAWPYAAKNEDGEVWAYDHEPVKREHSWSSAGLAHKLTGPIVIDIPGPWEESLRKNPHLEDKHE